MLPTYFGPEAELNFHPESDTLHEECGVVGMYDPRGEETETIALQTYVALMALQHRGQEAAGIAVKAADSTMVVKDKGLVNEVFHGGNLLAGLGKGSFALGQVRYGTDGKDRDGYASAQPFIEYTPKSELVFATNGQVNNCNELGDKFGIPLETCATDSEVFSKAITAAYRGCGDIEKALREVLPLVNGSFSLEILVDNSLVVARDSRGMRPLSLGSWEKGGYIVASESGAIYQTGAQLLRDVQPGEMIIINKEGLRSSMWTNTTRPGLCIFEYVYFARADAKMGGEVVAAKRNSMGALLAKVAPVDADMVIPVPDSATDAAIGYAQASGIPYGHGFLKNRYVGRTFIQSTQESRQAAIRIKFSPIPEAFEGKSVVVVDDSLVRGNTTKQLVEMIHRGGAKEVHVRISSDRLSWPCFYGVDTSNQQELIAAHMTTDEIRRYIGADSLAYLPIDLLRQAIGKAANLVCAACMTGQYPTDVSTQHIANLPFQTLAKA